MFPIEIVNKILIYVSELNNDIIITKYNIITNKEYYKINFVINIIENKNNFFYNETSLFNIFW